MFIQYKILLYIVYIENHLIFLHGQMKMLMIMAKKILTILLSSMIYSMVSARNRNCLEGSILQQELQKKQQNLFNSGKEKD